MYALIYDEFDPTKREKEVISVHKTRENAEKALEKWPSPGTIRTDGSSS